MVCNFSCLLFHIFSSKKKGWFLIQDLCTNGVLCHRAKDHQFPCHLRLHRCFQSRLIFISFAGHKGLNEEHGVMKLLCRREASCSGRLKKPQKSTRSHTLASALCTRQLQQLQQMYQTNITNTIPVLLTNFSKANNPPFFCYLLSLLLKSKMFR